MYLNCLIIWIFTVNFLCGRSICNFAVKLDQTPLKTFSVWHFKNLLCTYNIFEEKVLSVTNTTSELFAVFTMYSSISEFYVKVAKIQKQI